MTNDYLEMMTQFELPSNPFPGLRPFEFNESLLYFGRDGQSEQLLRKLSVSRFMAVIGTSGSGKSSLVRAGLLPALFGGFMASAGSDWRIAIFRPSNDPIGNLARAINDSGVFGESAANDAGLQAMMTEATLRRGSLGLVEAIRQARIGSHENVLVVVDQFEELFRFEQVAESEQYKNDAAAFVKLLLESSHQKEAPIYVVLTMRSDFLGDCSRFWDLPEAINEGQYLIPRLTREQRREAITGPIAVCGADITPRLVNRLLNDMGDNPDQLPILQHALMRTWQNWKENHRADEPIDLHYYEEIGGMSAALSRHADEAYNELPDERSRKIAEKMFKGLTEKGADNREIRRPIELKELCALTEASEEEVIRVIEVFRHEDRSFLMPPAGTRLDSDSLIDISHESLIRNWERLKNWVDDEARSARIYSRLAETAVLYPKEVPLYSDPALQLALDWRDESKPNKTWARRYHPEFETAMNFLDSSREAREREAREREAQSRKEIKRTRRMAIIFGLAFLLSLAALVFANSKRVEANASKEQLASALLEANEQKGKALEQTIIAGKERDKAEAKAKEAEELSLKKTAAEEDAKEKAIIASENAAKAKSAALEARTEAKRAADEEKKAEYEAERSRQFLYAANLTSSLEAYNNGKLKLARELLEDKTAVQEDLKGFEWHFLHRLFHREAGTHTIGNEKVKSVIFSPDNKFLVVGGEHSVRLLDAKSRQEKIPLSTNKAVEAMAFSPDSKLLAYGGPDTPVRVFNLDTGKEIAPLPGNQQPISSLLFSPDSKTLYAGGSGVKAWDVEAGREPSEVPGIKSKVKALAISPDGKKLAIVSRHIESNDTLGLYDTESHQLESIYAPTPKSYETKSPETLSSVTFSPDGKTVSVVSDLQDLLTQSYAYLSFDVATKKSVHDFREYYSDKSSDRIVSAFSPDGNVLAIARSNTLKLYTVMNLGKLGELSLVTPLLEQKETITSLAFSPDGKTLVANDSNQVRFWDAALPREHVTILGYGQVFGAAFSPDSKSISAVSYNRLSNPFPKLKFLDATSYKELDAPPEADEVVRQVAFSPDGRFLATINSNQDTIKVWDSVSRKLLATKTEKLNQPAPVEEIINSITISPDGKTLAAINKITALEIASGKTGRYILKLWNVYSPDKPVILKNSIRNSSNRIKFSSDGRTLAYFGGDDEKTVQLWDIASQKPVPLSSPQISAIKNIVFSPDGSTIIITGEDGKGSVHTELWYAHQPSFIKTLANGKSDSKRLVSIFSNSVYEINDSDLKSLYSPDGKILATADYSEKYHSVKLWDVRDVKRVELLHEFKDFNDFISSIAFSHDGKTIAIGSRDNVIKLLSLSSSYSLLANLSNLGLFDPIAFDSIAFSPDNRMLITVSKDGMARLWPTSVGKK